MIAGRYRDVVVDRHGHVAVDTGWRSNVIAGTTWPVVTALLRNDPAIRGLLFCAVGAGEAAWDEVAPAARSTTTRLRAEHDRRVLGAETFAYLDARGLPAPRPTDRLEVTTLFSWAGEPRVLREFGLFGGDATVSRDSGYLINYVIHPRIDVRAGATLTRRVRFTLRPGVATGGFDWLTLPLHWLRNEPLELLDGIGESYAAALGRGGVDTIGALADVEPASPAEGVPQGKLVELRAKARLTLHTAAALTTVPALADRSAVEIIASTPDTLAAAVGVPVTAVATLREQLGALQLTLDARYLRRVTVGELTGDR